MDVRHAFGPPGSPQAVLIRRGRVSPRSRGNSGQSGNLRRGQGDRRVGRTGGPAAER